MQHTATHWNSLQRTATHCNALQRTAAHCEHCDTMEHESGVGWYWRAASCCRWRCSTLQETATQYNTMQRNATQCSTLHRTETHCTARSARCWRSCCKYESLQYTATHCNTLQHTAIHCKTLRHTATQCNAIYQTATSLTLTNPHTHRRWGPWQRSMGEWRVGKTRGFGTGFGHRGASELSHEPTERSHELTWPCGTAAHDCKGWFSCA